MNDPSDTSDNVLGWKPPAPDPNAPTSRVQRSEIPAMRFLLYWFDVHEDEISLRINWVTSQVPALAIRMHCLAEPHAFFDQFTVDATMASWQHARTQANLIHLPPLLGDTHWSALREALDQMTKRQIKAIHANGSCVGAYAELLERLKSKGQMPVVMPDGLSTQWPEGMGSR